MKDADGNELVVGDLVYADSPTHNDNDDQFIKAKIIRLEETVILVNPGSISKQGFEAVSFTRAPEEVSKELFRVGDRCVWVGDVPIDDPNVPLGIIIGEAIRYPDPTIPGVIVDAPAWVVQFDNLGMSEVQLVSKTDSYLKPHA
jgi:hypothetical protein